MTIETLGRACRANPFRPFTLHLADGRSFRVPHPEFIAFNPRGRIAVVMDETDAAEYIDLLLVVSLRVEGEPVGSVQSGVAAMREVRPIVLHALIAIALASGTAGAQSPDYRAGSLGSEDPQPVYSADASDCGNRIFHALFARAVRFRLSGEFASGVPTERASGPGSRDLLVSRSVFERIEGGDRAIEPLDGFPVHVGSKGSPQRVLADPHFGQLREALAELLREGPSRPPLARAIMQADLWAAHDILFAVNAREEPRRGRREELLSLLAGAIRKLALTRREIEGLPDNLAEARLPFDLTAPGGEWTEVEFHQERLHESSSDLRRVARVFLKPSPRAGDRREWLESLRREHGQRPDSVAGAALLVQLQLVDSEGLVVPSRLTYEVQVREYPRAEAPRRPADTRLTVAELSRKALLLDRRPGGLVLHDDREPAYLPASGNDYFFGSSHPGRSGQTILTTQRQRCESCHGAGVEVLFTFSVHDTGPPTPIRTPNPGETGRPRDLARLKMEREDYRELMRRWGR